MRVVVLDAEALSSLARSGPRERTVRDALTAAKEVGAKMMVRAKVIVPAAVLAELYRGGGHDQAVDACLAREGGITVVPTDRALARRIGNILVKAGRGSKDHVDATVVAVCAAAGGGVVLTGDPKDLSVLAGGDPAITIYGI